VKALGRSWFFTLLLATWFSTSLQGQSTTVIRDTEAIEHPGQYVTVEGTVVAVFTSNNIQHIWETCVEDLDATALEMLLRRY
jgi:hypothetical protein